MSTHNICFYGELEKIISELSSQNYHQILLLNKSSGKYSSLFSNNDIMKENLHLHLGHQIDVNQLLCL